MALLAMVSVLEAAPARQAIGTIEGRIRYEGPPPADVLVPESGAMQKTLHVSSAGGLQYAVVYLPDALRTGAPREAAFDVDQRQFVFVPPVIAVRAGQPVRFTNSDTANHNVRATDSIPENTFALDTSAADTAGKVRRFSAPQPMRPVRLSCDIHPWMTAWVYAFEHDQFAATDANGRIRIDRVPAGRHRVAVRHPAGGLERDLSVEVRPGETALLDVRFTPADVHMPSR
jgi:plastocyanin